MIRRRVGAVRAILVATASARALLFAAAAAVAVLIVVASVDLLVELSVRARLWARAAAVVAGLFAAAASLRRDRHVFSVARVALWIEEKHPELEYAVVTALERGTDGLDVAADPAWVASARRGSAASLTAPLAAMAVVFAAFAVLPDGALARARAPHKGDSLDRPVVPAGARGRASSRLDPLVVEIAPPAYRAERSEVIEDPSTVAALVGSTITIRGRGDGAGIAAAVGSAVRSVTTAAQRWSVSTTMPPRAAAVRLTDGEHVRLLGLEPVEDPAPVVTLQRPLRDSVVRNPVGRIGLEATASDDHAIAFAAFEIIVSSGEGEAFTFRTAQLGAVYDAGRRAALAASLSLDSLALGPGDVVHLRAIARDRNTVTGPGLGSSETRTIRVARASEYDSVAVEPAGPADEEQQILSQRMLIMLTEALDERRTRLNRTAVLAESRRISVDQKRLRRSVGEVVFMRLSGDGEAEHSHDDGHDHSPMEMTGLLERAEAANRAAGAMESLDHATGGESPIVAINRPLLEAFNAMWDAAMELDQGEPRAALPHMYRALEAIQRARAAERVYLRGRPRPVVVDLARVRMQGRERGTPSLRSPGDVLPAQRLAQRLGRAIELHAVRPDAAVDSLLLLRLDALEHAPELARALGDVTDALRRGNEAAAVAALARARRAAGGPTTMRDALTPWSGAAVLP